MSKAGLRSRDRCQYIHTVTSLNSLSFRRAYPSINALPQPVHRSFRRSEISSKFPPVFRGSHDFTDESCSADCGCKVFSACNFPTAIQDTVS
jgi:hypothetical protein